MYKFTLYENLFHDLIRIFFNFIYEEFFFLLLLFWIDDKEEFVDVVISVRFVGFVYKNSFDFYEFLYFYSILSICLHLKMFEIEPEIDELKYFNFT